MKNYYQNVERKFTILNLEIRKLDKFDFIILILFGFAIFLNILISKNYQEYLFESNLIISFIVINFMISTSSFLVRFRNIYFSLIWIVLSLIFLFTGNSIAKAPFLLFLLFHFLRFIFLQKYGREFIPYTSTKFKLYRYVSKIEGRGGYKEDRKFTKILIVLGILVILFCISGFIK